MIPEKTVVTETKTISSITVAVSVGIVVLLINIIFVPIVWNEITSTWEELDRELRNIEVMRTAVKETLEQIPTQLTRQVREIIR
ncbi:unnamed protein product [Strongylus vulgaris]|uniref:Nematode cuticle collagen N-terminal domain-containing protein n=1 Tax=Strongylus vulgaris TaxID=40348 RepID=A0A3P7K2F5_STRVU|nr:unnamed protein product [Strongylus vulgaris]